MRVRVHEYAKEANVKSREIIDLLTAAGIEVKSHMSVIDPEVVKVLDKKYKKKAKPKSAPKTEKKSEEQVVSKKAEEKAPRRTDAEKFEVKKPAPKKEAPKKEITKISKKVLKPIEVVEDPDETGDIFAEVDADELFKYDDYAQRAKPKITKKKKGSNVKKVKAEEEVRVSNVVAEVEAEENVVYYSEELTVGDLCDTIGKSSAEVLKQLLMLGIMASVNQSLDRDTVELIADEAGFEVKDKVFTDVVEFEKLDIIEDEANLIKRPPVVTIMGHVDHGKTTLLDTIRKSRVTSGEAGGITQHIGAYQVEHNGDLITFLDTPGHAAFTSMRARGAKVTDICILVVAADDGVMPQTKEAVDHAKAAGVPIIVAVNKMDKPEANPDRVMQELLEQELVPEEWGGDTIYVKISAKAGEGIEDLLEMVTLTAEMQDFKANPKRLSSGTVIEAKLDKGRGPVATLLVENGTLQIGDAIVVGDQYGRVRTMIDDLGKNMKNASPSTPVEITGIHGVPLAGDRFMVFPSEKEARQIAEKRAVNTSARKNMPTAAVTLDDLFSQISEGDIKELNVIIKGDVQGSVEALSGSLQKIDVEGVDVKIIRASVGTITENDVTFALASHAIIIGFNVRPTSSVRLAADNAGVDMRLHSIIYNAIDEIEAAMKGLLDPVFVEKVTGQLEIRQLFKVSKVGTIGGCYVTEGTVNRNSGVRVIRDGIVVFEGNLASLKRFKDEVREVNAGYECGILVERFNDIKEGDVIEAYIMEEVPR
ncbi:MAG: translation initiation factor IF-2 [Turicibacter sp.]|nr:translation initiation factor IF-2 [Turicibacter sp.]